MCSAGASLEIAPLASRAEASLRRTDANVASLAACWRGLSNLLTLAFSAAIPDAVAANKKKRVARVLFIFPKHLRLNFDDFEAGLDFYGRAECSCNAAILVFRELDRLRYGFCGKVGASQNMMHLH